MVADFSCKISTDKIATSDFRRKIGANDVVCTYLMKN